MSLLQVGKLQIKNYIICNSLQIKSKQIMPKICLYQESAEKGMY